MTATGANNGDKAILKITLIDNRGKEISASRVLEYFNGDALVIINRTSTAYGGKVDLAIYESIGTALEYAVQDL